MSSQSFSRRAFLSAAGTFAVVGSRDTSYGLAAAAIGAAPKGKIERIERKGVLIGECSLPDETRKDDMVPAHPNGIQASRNRWLLIYATRGFRGVDDDCSIVYQLREGSPDGRLVKEGMLAKSSSDWDPFGTPTEHSIVPGGEGRVYVKQHGHPVLFGVPRGAYIKGKPAPSANVFVAKWRRVARILDPKRNYMEHGTVDLDLSKRTQAVEWVQFRLNDREDDIEIIQPAAVLRQKGYETGAAFSSVPAGLAMNQSFVQAVPWSGDATEWVDANHFAGSVAALRYAFNRQLGRYEWVETGPFLTDPRSDLGEASVARAGSDWVICARGESGGRIAWIRTANPFGRIPEPSYAEEPKTTSPFTAYACPDGVVRLCSGNAPNSPYKNGRDPLYMWDIDPDAGFAVSNRQVLFDSVKAGLPIRPGSAPKVDMCKLLPHQGRVQFFVHRVSIRAFNHPYVGSARLPTKSIPIANQEEKAACAVYYGTITYRESFPSLWDFPGAS